MNEPNAEQALMEAVNIGATIERAGPQNKQLLSFVDKRNSLWQKQPYQHEYALTKMFFGFQERGKSLYQEDLADIINIFQ
jgi:hypothetical protein